jgi:acetolactate synthase-1/2/3 large subunit
MWKREYYTESSELEPYGYYYAMNRLRRDDDIIALDVGNHQMWALQSLSFAHGQRLASSSGLSTMGYGLPAAIGAYYADPTADTVCICGDGGLQMMLPEFELLRRERLPITVIVMNDASLGMIRMLQDTYYGGNHAGSVQDYSAPDFASVARAYGLRSCVAESVPEFEKQFARRGGEPLVVEVRLHEECDVRPRIISKKPIWDMYPFLPEDEIGKNMVVPYGGASHE